MFRVAYGASWGQVGGFAGDGLLHAFSTRSGGVSEGPYASLNLGLHSGDGHRKVVENRERAFQALGIPLDWAVFPRQVHGTTVRRVGLAQRGAGAREAATALAGTDGLITSDRNVVLAVLCADCAPVYFFDPRAGAVGIVHAGWRGTVGNIAAAAVAAMGREFGTRPADLYAAIGPCIGPCCYPVGPEVAGAFRRAGLAGAVAADPQGAGRWRVDLAQALRQQLAEAGVAPRRTYSADVCTHCRDGLFFSHRRAGGPAGRMAAVIGLVDAGGVFLGSGDGGTGGSGLR